MGVRRGLIFSGAGVTLACLAFACLTLGACKTRNDAPTPPETRPPDHLAPDEVVEGKERAFGLPLPRVGHVDARFATSVLVSTPLTPEQLVNFVRKRVKDGKDVPGASVTRLEQVVPRDDDKKRLDIEVRPKKSGEGMRSEMVVRDATPPPTEPGLSDEERWRRAGLKPDGTLLDPKKLQ